MKWIGIALVSAAVVAIIIIKAVGGSSNTQATASTGAPRVLLFADLSEEEDSCGCGQIIRAVRSAEKRGIPTRENDEALGKKYRVTTEPTVLIIGSDGSEKHRFEGESGETIKKLKAEISKLPSGG